MYYEMEWYEEKTNRFQRVFQAKDVPALWRAVHYMNMERKERKLPLMKRIQITILDKYSGDYSVITGSYIKDLLLDKYLDGTIRHNQPLRGI